MIILKRHKKLGYSLIIILIVLFLLYFICTDLTFRNDESYTMALIKHSVISTIKLNSFDVHPALYYILLKLFLDTITFYTNSIFIKIIFARIFSLIAFIIGFYVINSILHNSRRESLLLFILVIIFPSVLHFATLIRMYSLAGMLLSLEFYNLFKFMNTNLNKYVIYSLLFTILAAYTDYFTAVSAGVMLFICFFVLFIQKRYVKSMKICLDGIVLAVLYVPQLLFSTSKISLENRHSINYIKFMIHFFPGFIKKSLMSFTGLNESSLMTKNNFIRDALYILLGLTLLYLIYKSYTFMQNNIREQLLTLSLCSFLLTCAIGEIAALNWSNFAIRVVYPIFVINIILIMNTFILVLRENKKLLINIALLIILITSFVFSSYYSVVNCYQSIKIFKLVKQNIYKPTFIANDSDDRLNRFSHYQALLTHGYQFKLANNATYYLYYNKRVFTNNLYHKDTSVIQPNGIKIDKQMWPNIVKDK